MAKLNDDWFNTFNGSFKYEEDVIEFIYEHLDTRDFEDSYINLGVHGDANEIIVITSEDKRQRLYDFMMWLIDRNK